MTHTETPLDVGRMQYQDLIRLPQDELQRVISECEEILSGRRGSQNANRVSEVSRWAYSIYQANVDQEANERRDRASLARTQSDDGAELLVFGTPLSRKAKEDLASFLSSEGGEVLRPVLTGEKPLADNELGALQQFAARVTN